MNYSEDDATGWGCGRGWRVGAHPGAAESVPALPTAQNTSEPPGFRCVGCWVCTWPTARAMQISVTPHWFQTGKGEHQGCILSPCLFNLYAEYIMRNAGLEETQAGIKIARICLILTSRAPRHLRAHLPDTRQLSPRHLPAHLLYNRQLSRSTPDCSSA